jgi:hypothetical protein
VQAAANVRDLAEAARARLLQAETAHDLPALTESLADSVAGLRRYRFMPSWGARSFGGSKRVGAVATVDGATVSGQDGTVTLPGSGGAIFGIVLVVLAVLGGGGAAAWFLVKRGGGGRGGKLDDLLQELQQIVRLGTPADEAVMDLSQRFPDSIDKLRTLDLGKLDPARYRYLRTRAGQSRIKEIKKQLDSDDAEPVVGEEVAQILSGGMSKGQKASDVARQIRARVGDDKLAALSRAKSDNLRGSLARVAHNHAPLKASRAVDFAAEVQEALRSASGPPLAVGWFVRATGPGKRGQTVAIPVGRAITIGKSADCQVQIPDDQQLADKHAELRELDGEFLIRPLEGRVAVEEKELQAAQPLTDGVTVTLGGCRYVFKCVVGR